MCILLFDLANARLTLIVICVVLINCCGLVCTKEETTQKTHPAVGEIVSATPVKQQKPSSVIYISSLDDVNPVGLHSSEHDIRFEDFFWNGSGDEPLTLSLKSNARLTVNGFSGRETFIKTATVIATVYIDDSNEVDENQNCDSNNCDNGIDDEPHINLPVNKHFWLVTTVLGHLDDADIPLLQERLADVYRIAFTKQQSVHLGLSNVTIESTIEPMPIGALANDTTPIIENTQSTNLSMPINATSVLKYEYIPVVATEYSSLNASIADATHPLQSTALFVESVNSSSASSTVSSAISSDQSERQRRTVSSIAPTAMAKSTVVVQATTAKSHTNHSKAITTQDATNHEKPITDKTVKATKKHRNDAIIGRIDVLIHNISVISNADKDYLENAEHQWMAAQGTANDSNFSTETFTAADNQTEIIYTVFVNGLPVLASIAANDMKLMSDAEVANILDKPVFTKAEPYLKEPQATPLIPSSTMTTNQNKPILAMIFQNPYVLTFIGGLVLLLILLLMLLMLITTLKSHRNTAKKGVSKAAQTAQQSFLPPLPRTASEHIGSIDESRTQSMARQKKQVGTQITSLHDSVDGFGCERDHSFIIIPTPLKRKHHKKVGTPTIYFPEPPSSEPSSCSSSSTTTSDTSSIYYIKKHKHRRHSYSKRPKRLSALNHREYATITKKQIERAQKKTKHKRNYLKNGNRVGAVEETIAQVHSSRSSSLAGQRANDCRQSAAVQVSDDTFEMSTGKDSNLYEHIEAFNPMVGKQKLHTPFTSAKQMDNAKITTSDTEKQVQSKSRLSDKRQNKKVAVNHTTMNAITTNSTPMDRQKKGDGQQPAHTSNDSVKLTKTDRFANQLSNDEVPNDDLSIGSFLSMASIRSFPKCNVPDPLSRVLEPVSITYLDQYDEIEATEAATIASKLPRIVDAKAKQSTVRTQRDPVAEQKSDEIVYLSRTRSDGADPGVIGPIAWQYHKRRLDEQENLKHHRDPMCTQHRYEDLLEGAISLYSIETTEYHTIETITKEEFPEILIGKDMRGKSAEIFTTSVSASKSSPRVYRPFTAMPPKTAPEEPPITSKGAWTGSSLIRPASAESKPSADDKA